MSAEKPIETAEEVRQIEQWVDAYFEDVNNGSENLVTTLQATQDRFGYLSNAGMKRVAAKKGLTPANVFGVATFYNQFRFTPPGKHDIKVCMGTACAIKGAQLIVDQWERKLGIKVGEVTEDREYSLDRVDCVGCCTLAPVAILGDEVIAEMAVTKVDGILFRHQIERDRAKATEKPGEGAES